MEPPTARASGVKPPPCRSACLRHEHGLSAIVDWCPPDPQPVRRCAGLGRLADEEVRRSPEQLLRRTRRFDRAAKAAAVSSRRNVIQGADQHHVERLATDRSFRARCTARQRFDRLAQGIGIVVAGDLVIPVAMHDFGSGCNVTRHLQQQRERHHLLVAEQVDVHQLRDRLGIRKQDAARGTTRGDRIRKRECGELLVDALVGLATHGHVSRPGHFERREVVRIGARAQQPEDMVAAILDFDPDRLDAGRRHVRAEQPLAVLRSEHGGTHLYRTLRLRHRPGPQGRVARVRRSLPGSAGAQQQHRAGDTREANRLARPLHCRAHGMVSPTACLTKPPPGNRHGRILISVSEVGELSNTST